MKSKETLRKTIQSKRRFVDPEVVQDKSHILCQKVVQLPCLASAQTMLLYLAKPDEVSTAILIDWAFEQKKKLLIPITSGHGQLEWSELRPEDTLKNGPLGIPIPETLRPLTPPENAPVIVPCVAFSENGHRIGHGAGYYDRFLATRTGYKIAIAFELQHVPEFEIEAHDIPMDAIITESAQYILNDAVLN